MTPKAFAVFIALVVAALTAAILLVAFINTATAKTNPDKPDPQLRLPTKAVAKRDCRVTVGRGVYLVKTPDGQIRTRC